MAPSADGLKVEKGENKKSEEIGEPKVLAAPDGDMKVEVLPPTPSSAKVDVDNLLFWAFALTHLLLQYNVCYFFILKSLKSF